jgi:hypothetical protein
MNELQKMAVQLQLTVTMVVRGHNAIEAADWADEVVEEAFAESPRCRYLRIYLDEVEKRAPRSHEVLANIESIKHLLHNKGKN